MRLPLLIASIVCYVIFIQNAAAASHAKKQFSARKAGMIIRVHGGGWGSARPEDVEPVLYAVADELMTQLPAKLEVPILVTHTDGPPMALYQKGPRGEYRVELHARNRQWGAYAYEFAHELCHILSNYDAHAGRSTRRYNQWFEETLCEAASLYTLRRLADTWASADAPKEWRGHAEKLSAFADRIIGEDHRELPPETSLASWLRNNEESLRGQPYLRQHNEVVANLLLPLFETNPESWDSLRYLNLEPSEARRSLRRFLHAWYDTAPAQHKAFVARVLALLGIDEPMDEARAWRTGAATGREPAADSGAAGPQRP